MARRLAPLALALAACAHAAPPAPPPKPAADPPSPPDPIPAIRAEVEALLRDQAEAYWKAWIGGDRADVPATYRTHAALLSPQTLSDVEAALRRASGEERRALTHLRAYLVGEILARESAEASERAAASEASATFPWEGKEVPARQLSSMLAAEDSAQRRAALENAHDAARDKWSALAAKEDQAIRAAVRKLGYPDTLALAGELRGAQPAALGALAGAVLDATEPVYLALMEELSRRELDMPAARARLRDLPRLFRTAHEPAAFPSAQLVPNALVTFQGLALDLQKVPGLVLDLEPRAGKSFRPIALPVEVPGSIRVSAVPVGGVAEARALMHELGAAAYYAHDSSPVMEFRRLGPSSLPDTWALLFEGLCGDPAWLSQRTALSGIALSREVRAAAAETLHAARLGAARLLLELERARDPARTPDAERRLLSRALGRPVEAEEPSRWPLAPDPLLRSAEMLRARLLAAQAEAFLAGRAGGPWWRSRQNGEWLAATWSQGSRISPEELAASLQQPASDPGAFAAQAAARAATAGVRP